MAEVLLPDALWHFIEPLLSFLQPLWYSCRALASEATNTHMGELVTKTLFVVVAALGINAMVLGQTKPSLQGVWRAVEITVTNPNPPPNARPKGTHTNLQPGLLIFTAKHYSWIADTAAEPRPTTPVKEQGKPTVEELQARWGPFIANAGTYEVSGDTVTAHTVVAKSPALQAKGVTTRSTIKLDGNNLWVTPLEGPEGKVQNPGTVKYVRVE